MSKFTAVVSAFALSAFAVPAAADNWEVKEQLVHGASHTVNVDLNATTVLCSAADYGAPFLKVLVPALAGITLLNHQNTGAGAPCVAAGKCIPHQHEPQTILNPEKPTETVDITVQAFRADVLEHDAKTCESTLIERINVTIRGVAFFHEESAILGPRPYSDCL